MTSAADVYALGVTLIELLTGQCPFAQVVVAGRVPPPSGAKLLDDLIARMTAYDPTDRPLLDDVDDVLSNVHKMHVASSAAAK